jgi:hypothetical protein
MARNSRKAKPLTVPPELLARYRSGELGINALAKILHTHQAKVTRELHRRGIDTGQSGRQSLREARRKGYKSHAAMHEKVVRLYAEGLSLRQVARETGLSAPGVRKILLRRGVRLRRRRRG